MLLCGLSSLGRFGTCAKLCPVPFPGGITIVHGQSLGDGLNLSDLQAQFSAVFIGVGLGTSKTIGFAGETLAGVDSAIDFIEGLRQSEDKSKLLLNKPNYI